MAFEIDKKMITALDLYKEGLFTNIFVKRVAKNASERRSFYRRLSKLRHNGTIKIIDFKDVDIKRALKGKILNYLPKNEIAVKQSYPEAFKVPIELKILKTEKYKKEVIKPILKWFKEEVKYDLEPEDINRILSSSVSEEEKNRRVENLDKSIQFWSRYSDTLPTVPMKITLWDTYSIRSIDTIYLDNFEKYHAKELFQRIYTFEEKYKEYWINFYKIQKLIIEVITAHLNLPICDFLSHKYKDSYVTTNLQFFLFDHLLSNFQYVDLTVNGEPREHNNSYEYWRGYKIKRCFLKVKAEGKDSYEWYFEINRKISDIVKEMKQSRELIELAGKTRALRNDAQNLCTYIIDDLQTILLDKEVLDGQWGDISLPKE